MITTTITPHNRFPNRRTLAMTALAAASLGGCVSFSAKYSAVANASKSASGVSALRVTNQNGSVSVVEDAAAATASINAEIKCWGATQEEADARVKEAQLVVNPEPNGQVWVRVEFPEPRMPQDSARIEVRVASLTQLAVTSTNGAIGVTGLSGPLTASSSNGAIEIARHGGDATLETSNGRITVKDAGGSVGAKTSNGAIEVSLADGNASGVDAETSNGAIDISMKPTWQGTITGSTSNGRITIEAPGNDGKPREVTGNATATTTVGASGATAAVKARTSNGSVRVRVGG